MINFWAIACGALLYFINYFIWIVVHTGILHGGLNPLPWNIFHLLMNTGIAFLIGYGLSGILLGSILGITCTLCLAIIRIITEDFEWK